MIVGSYEVEVYWWHVFQKINGMQAKHYCFEWVLLYYHDVWEGEKFQETELPKIGYSMTKPMYNSHNAVTMSM